MARTVKQVAKASLSARSVNRRVRTVSSASTGSGPDVRTAPNGQEPSASPIYEELVAELGDPTA